MEEHEALDAFKNAFESLPLEVRKYVATELGNACESAYWRGRQHENLDQDLNHQRDPAHERGYVTCPVRECGMVLELIYDRAGINNDDTAYVEPSEIVMAEDGTIGIKKYRLNTERNAVK